VLTLSNAVRQDHSPIVIARRSRSACGGNCAHRSIATASWFLHVERGVADLGERRQRAAMRHRWRAAQKKRRGSLRLEIFLKAQRLRA